MCTMADVGLHGAANQNYNTDRYNKLLFLTHRSDYNTHGCYCQTGGLKKFPEKHEIEWPRHAFHIHKHIKEDASKFQEMSN